MTEYINRFRPSAAEIERRYANIRQAMEAHGLDYLVVSGSEYSGFEGAVRYMCGFHILHRYAYVIVPLNDDPICVFPREATWVGDHSATTVERPTANPDAYQAYLKGQDALEREPTGELAQQLFERAVEGGAWRGDERHNGQ